MKTHHVVVFVAALFFSVGALQAGPIPTAGLAAWYNASALVGLSNGDPVTTWTDSSGNGLNVTAVGSPTYDADALNGQPAVSFGPGAYFALGGVSGSNWGASGADIFLVLEQNGANPNNTAFSWAPDSSDRFLVHATYADTLHFQYGSPFGDVNSPEPAGWDNTFNLVEASWNGSTGEISVDGALLATGNLTSSLNTALSATLYIGNDIFGNNFQGQIAQIIVYNQALSPTDEQTVLNYLDAQYDFSSVPEPAGWVLGASALAAILWLRRRSARWDAWGPRKS